MSGINLEQVGSMARLSISRPETKNAINRALLQDLKTHIDELSQDDSVRVIILEGENGAFSSGQDLKSVKSAEDIDVRGEIDEGYTPLILAMRNCPKIILGLVDGPAVGAGFSLALACDILVASRRSYFMAAFIHIGLVPDSGLSYFLPRKVGISLATSWILTGHMISAEEAYGRSLVYQMYEDDEFEKNAMKLAIKLSKMPTKALALTKNMLNKTMENDLVSQLDLECESQVEASQTDDFKEGIMAFLEKRKPNFKGK